MNGTRRFEWALVGDVFDEAAVIKTLHEPRAWLLLSDKAENVDLVTAWFELEKEREAGFDLLLVSLDPNEPNLHCRSTSELSGGLCICLVRELCPTLPPGHDPKPFDEVKRVLIREVPPTFMLTCSIYPARLDYKAVFTTLAGNVMTECWIGSPPEELDPHECTDLTGVASTAAADQGHLQSQNQKVCVMLEGSPEPLGIETVPDFVWYLLEADQEEIFAEHRPDGQQESTEEESP